ncbi:MAG TPA: topoisomerase C-terminal repeat-containing protein, partial [Wenzhouxiangella sp.]|nr:topoisomerase C-terminal repeat-containing protein [Wenzhouxiangella sp.]
FSDEGIQVLKGRYGPFVTDGKRNASVPKDQEPEKLTLEQCRKMLDEAPPKGRRGKFGKKKAGGKKTAAKKTSKKKSARKKASKKKKKKTTKKKTSA